MPERDCGKELGDNLLRIKNDDASVLLPNDIIIQAENATLSWGDKIQLD